MRRKLHHTMTSAAEFEVIRDPLWNNIRIDAEALAVLDSEPFQRLRYIRQLGHAFLVYPGATHTRFEHALGTYHLARRTLALLRERGELDGISRDELILIHLAALLHDVGHYPFSHALEEAGLPSHEVLATEQLRQASLRDALLDTGIDRVEPRLTALIEGCSSSPLQGLVSGSLDLDKIEYLTRDARMCGVPYGTVDVDRLIHSITLIADGGSRTVAVHEKGVSALESLLFAKYQMYRNVYWHHAVRSATAMFKRLVQDTLVAGILEADWIAQTTDEVLMERLHSLPNAPLAMRLKRRQLYKRVLDIPAGNVRPDTGGWISEDPELVRRVEDRIALEHDLEPGDVLLDFPKKPQMLEVELPVRTRNGAVVELSGETGSDWLGIQRISHELHTSARRLRVFAARPVAVHGSELLGLVERTDDAVRGALEQDRGLLSTRD
ncbi:MAG: HD domain-containing protein [Gemmatimonadota bacterium]|nr:MAG: HD domain-containing protein [Gemmatimonadota bacterium]